MSGVHQRLPVKVGQKVNMSINLRPQARRGRTPREKHGDAVVENRKTLHLAELRSTNSNTVRKKLMTGSLVLWDTSFLNTSQDPRIPTMPC